MASPRIPNIATQWLMRWQQRSVSVSSEWEQALKQCTRQVVAADSALPAALGTGLPHDKVVALRREFIGKPLLCFYNAQLIVCLRRGRSPASNFNLFSTLWRRYPDALAHHLNARWLLSSVDTFADLGAPGMRDAALAVSSFVNMARFADSEQYLRERAAQTASPIDLSDVYEDADSRSVLWDGIKIYNVVTGDGIENYLNRMHRSVEPYPAVRAIFDHLVARMLENDTMLSRMVAANERFDFAYWKRYATTA